MNLTNFSDALHWVLDHGYPIIFIGMLIEGPIITAAASFASALKYFDLKIIFILAILGDLVADFAYYAVGYFGHLAILKRYGHLFGISENKIENLKNLLERHPGKILAAIKLAPFVPTPGLIVAGATRMSFKKFTLVSTLITLPKVIIFMLLGYYFGQAYDKISDYIAHAGYFLIIFVAAAVLVYLGYKKITANISKSLERA